MPTQQQPVLSKEKNKFVQVRDLTTNNIILSPYWMSEEDIAYLENEQYYYCTNPCIDILMEI